MSFFNLSAPDAAVIKKRKAIARDIARLAPECVIVKSEDGRACFDGDAFGGAANIPLLAVLPASSEDVGAILAYCNDKGVKVAARGGGTGLTGGATPGEDMIALGLSRMRRIINIDTENRSARVEAGIANLALDNALAAKGFFYAPDPASRVASTIGGNIATNAGGPFSLGFGPTSQNLTGVKMALMSGEIIDIGGDYLDAGGYDFLALACGAEGQLGVVTEACLRILPKPEGSRPMMAAFGAAKQAAECVSEIMSGPILPPALEMLERRAIAICEQYAPSGYPEDAAALLLIEAQGSEREITAQFDFYANIARKYGASHIRSAPNEKEGRRLWSGQRSFFGAFGARSDYIVMDGALPASRIADMLGWIDHFCRHYNVEAASGFHAGDGCLYTLIAYDSANDGELARAMECAGELFRTCVNAGGCLGGQFGLGLSKRELLHHQMNEMDMLQHARIKTIFDPFWLLNPDKLFPADAPGRGGIDANLAELAGGMDTVANIADLAGMADEGEEKA
jgi:glycolate oxidase